MNENQWDRIADIYHDEVISPFYGKVENPLLNEIKKIKGKDKKTAAEFGCGIFYLGKTLSKSFKKVHASDFSSKMVELAKAKNKYNNIDIKKEDIRKIGYNDKFDVVISVNSLIMPSLNDTMKSFTNVYNSLKQEGDCLLIVPSMESVLYHGMLLLHDELSNKKEELAKKTAKRKFENEKYDHFLGHYKDGEEVQKFYYMHEIEFLLKKTGFKDVVIKKVKYPWGKEVSDYEDFPEEERLWDWFVKANK